MRHTATLLLLLLATSAFAGTTNNDDSCDIALQPAATLLLPYFEVDFKSPMGQGTTTLFTVQNVTNLPQIANVTLWTDWGYPALNFPMFLTGYDVASINLYDIFARATIVANATPSTTVPTNPTPGSQPAGNNANPNFLSGTSTACANAAGVIPSPLLNDLQLIFTTGKSSGAAITCPLQVGGVHSDAVGYITIDLVATCSTKNATSPGYFDGTVLFDNVLTGDYQQLVPRGAKSYAQGGPMVHIRAIPEGGAAGSVVATNLPYTFYDRFTAASVQRTIDRRQPLPSTFTPRFIAGGTNGFNSSFKIWREGVSPGNGDCRSYSSNSSMPFTEIVRFDEHENATVATFFCPSLCPPSLPGLPAAVQLSVTSSFIPPPSTSGDVAGWLYMNMNNGGSTAYSAASGRDFRRNASVSAGPRQSQNWVIGAMFAEPTYAVEMTAPALGNGCSPSPLLTINANGQIGPAPNVNP